MSTPGLTLLNYSGNMDGLTRSNKVGNDMSRTCDICGKHPMYGNKVSKSFNHTHRTWKPNLLKVKTELDGTTHTLNVCTRCLRSGFITKKVSVPKEDQKTSN